MILFSFEHLEMKLFSLVEFGMKNVEVVIALENGLTNSNIAERWRRAILITVAPAAASSS